MPFIFLVCTAILHPPFQSRRKSSVVAFARSILKTNDDISSTVQMEPRI